ncbi:(Fe-S)-binding protein [Kitasatospora sp. NPDC058406]|uniref:(Fe-S)-binding protein n=1 Tax=Kitasatospora sp. NPDC058406 TaxID=3346483 RepID=UPI003651340E
MRAALFVTCINDALYPSAAVATVKLLERLGVRVAFPAGQTCCGQPQFNTGYRTATEPLVRRMIDAFDDAEYVVTPSGSCAAMVRDNYPRIAARAFTGGRGSDLEKDARSLAARTWELTEFLTDVLGVVDVGAHFPHTVTYHPSCHGLRMLGLGERPRRLLERVDGLRLTDLPGAEECCGFGGTFAVKNSDVSAAMGHDKITNALSTGADVLCGGDNSCLMHLEGMLRRQGAPLRPLHLAEILASTVDDPWSP